MISPPTSIPPPPTSPAQVYGVVKNFQKAMQQRGGMWGMLKHMYTNGDYPFKVRLQAPKV